jgi:hypothetical protein
MWLPETGDQARISAGLENMPGNRKTVVESYHGRAAAEEGRRK